ncbi:MAG: hypothetical protein MUE63_15055, partial [Xanthomonadales bacterium]|nr:hypothetical protein [Xanthomonadales bacterium]
MLSRELPFAVLTNRLANQFSPGRNQSLAGGGGSEWGEPKGGEICCCAAGRSIGALSLQCRHAFSGSRDVKESSSAQPTPRRPGVTRNA